MAHTIDMRGIHTGAQASRLLITIHSLGCDPTPADRPWHQAGVTSPAGLFTDIHHPWWASPEGEAAVVTMRRLVWSHILSR